VGHAQALRFRQSRACAKRRRAADSPVAPHASWGAVADWFRSGAALAESPPRSVVPGHAHRTLFTHHLA